jgi:hypothetical protein
MPGICEAYELGMSYAIGKPSACAWTGKEYWFCPGEAGLGAGPGLGRPARARAGKRPSLDLAALGQGSAGQAR